MATRTGTPNLDIVNVWETKHCLRSVMCLLCVTGNNNVLERHARVHLPLNKVFLYLCGLDVPCPHFSVLQKWAD